MKIRVTFDLTEEDRKAIGHFFGKGIEHKASYGHCKAYLHGSAMGNLKELANNLSEAISALELAIGE